MKIKKLQDEYTKNIFRNYKIEEEIKNLLAKELNIEPKCYNFYVNMDSSYPNSVSLDSVRYCFKDTYQYKFYIDFKLPCYGGVSEKELIEHNKKNIEKKKIFFQNAKKIYFLFTGKELKIEDTNLN